MPKDSPPSFPEFCAMTAHRSTNQRGRELLIFIRGGLILKDWGSLRPSARTPYSPGPSFPTEMGDNPSHLRGPHPIGWHHGHNGCLQMVHIAFMSGNLNGESPLWNTNQSSHPRGEQLEDMTIANSASLLNDGPATLLNYATGDLSSPDISLTHLSEEDLYSAFP